ncbi:hypothetical protein SAMN04490369_10717 [Vreelandella aquamarina]|uniref:Uncharacterized protein n=2 Tax=Vreelandella aquamarina TaxID=77097 RepID=A0A1H8NT22_9GAMM|nr:hypothetical protein SAMN04490369_10717 [Halomonas aquamarina]|tara:strand:+ start:1941 stop:2423 length:483 start_codon:yes stop_codon:yes gene_type:complete
MLTIATARRYASRAGAKSSAWFGDRIKTWRTSAHRETGAFFASTVRVYGGCAWETAKSAGFQVSRFANLRTATPINCLATVGDGSTKLGDLPMASLSLPNLITRNFSSRAAAHRAMAKAALFADSSARTRLKRYNHHIEKAEALEARALETAKRSAGGVA